MLHSSRRCQAPGCRSVQNTTQRAVFRTLERPVLPAGLRALVFRPRSDESWSFASHSLPPDFALIPPDGPHAAVLSSVPGTAEAQLAVLQAQVPRQATLKKESAKLTVKYAGPPQFRPIPGTTMTYAVNTPFEVIETAGKFYACYQGAWFVGPSPTGPWVLATSVPQVIYTIPPSSPLYNVTYVKVYGATPVAVTYGYTSGYMMGFRHRRRGRLWHRLLLSAGGHPRTGADLLSVSVFLYRPGRLQHDDGRVGTGRRRLRPLWRRRHEAAPITIRPPGPTAAGGAIYGPNGGVSGVSYYNPSTGGYARGSAPRRTPTVVPPRPVSTIRAPAFPAPPTRIGTLTRAGAPVP